MNDAGSSMASVIVAMVLMGVCLPVLLANHTRGATAAWNANAEQQALAVAAWHTAAARVGGCAAVDDDGDHTNGYRTTAITQLAGQEFLPSDGFSVSCEIAGIEWPPDPLSPGAACSGGGCATVLTVTAGWERLNGTPRSLALSTLKPP